MFPQKKKLNGISQQVYTNAYFFATKVHCKPEIKSRVKEKKGKCGVGKGLGGLSVWRERLLSLSSSICMCGGLYRNYFICHKSLR